MFMPPLPPEDYYQMSRDRRGDPGSRRRTRHISSLDLHELGDAQDALRPDPVWMAIRRTVDRIGRLPIAQRVLHWLERRSRSESVPPEPNPSSCHPIPVTDDDTVHPGKRLAPGTLPPA